MYIKKNIKNFRKTESCRLSFPLVFHRVPCKLLYLHLHTGSAAVVVADESALVFFWQRRIRFIPSKLDCSMCLYFQFLVCGFCNRPFLSILHFPGTVLTSAKQGEGLYSQTEGCKSELQNIKMLIHGIAPARYHGVCDITFFVSRLGGQKATLPIPWN